MKIKFTAFLLVLSLIIYSCSFLTSATDNSQNKQVSIKQADGVLLANGFDEKSIAELNFEVKIRLASTLINSPSKVKLTHSNVQINEAAIIRDFQNMKDENLKTKYGISDDTVKKIHNDIKKLNEKTDDQIKQEYQKTDNEVQNIRKVLNNNQMELSSLTLQSISNINYHMWVYDDSGILHPVEYSVNAEFIWDSQPLLSWNYSDYVAFAWAGDLATDFTDAQQYNTVHYVYGIQHLDKNILPVENPVNEGLSFGFKQSIPFNQYASYYPSSGFFCFSLYQTSKNNPAKAGKIVSQYGHQHIAFSGMGFSLKSASVSFGSAFDTSDQETFGTRY